MTKETKPYGSDGKYKRTRAIMARAFTTRFENETKRPITLPRMPWDDEKKSDTVSSKNSG